MELRIISPEGWEKRFPFKKPVLSIGSQLGNDLRLDTPTQFQLILQEREITTLRVRLPAENEAGMPLRVNRNGRFFTLQPGEEMELYPGDSLESGTFRLIPDWQASQRTAEPDRNKRGATAWLWVALFLCLLAAASFIFLPRINEFSVQLPPEPLMIGDAGTLFWQANRFSSSITLFSGDQQSPVERTGLLEISPPETTVYRIQAENWLSRLIKRPAVKELTVPVSIALPGVRLESVRTAPNTYQVSWSVSGEVDQVSLTIGSQTEVLPEQEYQSSRTLPIRKDVEVRITAHNQAGTNWQSEVLAAEPVDLLLEKFIVWVQPESRSQFTLVQSEVPAEGFTEKLVELIPNETLAAGYELIHHQTGRTLNPREQIMLEWGVNQADTVMIEPLADRLLPESGAQYYYPEKSTNFLLSAALGDQLKTFTLPVTVKKEKAETVSQPLKIEQFSTNPVSLQQPGKVTLAWSVSGDWERIQLLSSSRTPTLTEKTPAGQPQTVDSGAILADYLNGAGFLSVNLAEDTSFILKASNSEKSDNAIVSVRVNPSAPAVVRKPLGIQITQLFSASGKFEVGEEITAAIAFSGLSSADPFPTGSVVISDGLSNCLITLPRSSCELKLRSAGNRAISARYGGNQVYQSAETLQSLVVTDKKLERLNLAASIFPDQAIQNVGEKVTVSAFLTPEFEGELSPTGTLFISDGLSNCLLTLPRNSCDLEVRSIGERTISISYSGDDFFHPAVTSLKIQAEKKESTPQPTPVLTPTALPLQFPIRIVGVFPQKSAYSIGDQIDIYVDPDYSSIDNRFPREKIQVSDGFATCLFSVESGNHCTMQLIDSSASQIIASFPGDGYYSPSQSEPWSITVQALPKAATQTVIASVQPNLASYRIGDQIKVSVSVTPDKVLDQPPSGEVTVSDGFSSCIVQWPEQDACSLTLQNGTAREITAIYAGDEFYASSVSAMRPIKISMLEVLAFSAQAMQFSTCDSFAPDELNPIPLQIDNAANPPIDYFTLDDRFILGSGFYLNVGVRSVAGNLIPDPGTFSARACSLNDPEICIDALPADAVRDSSDFTLASAQLEFPAVPQAGHFALTITFAGDPALYGTESSSFALRGFRRAALILTPHQQFSPDAEFLGYEWTGVEAADPGSTDYWFDAYLLGAGMKHCPIPLTLAQYAQPGGITLQIEVEKTVPGADQSDAVWQASLTANGYAQEIINRLQPNLSLWNQHACLWETQGENRAVHCSDVGLSEPSILRHALEHTDPNYQILDQNPLDSFSDVFIQAKIAKQRVFFHAPNLSGQLTGGVPYWINYRGASFAYFTAPECLDDGQQGYQTANHRIPANQVLSIQPLVLARSQLDRKNNFSAVNEPYQIHYEPSANILSALTNYHGVCGNCLDWPIMEFTYIPNEGCAQTSAGVITVQPGAGTLFGGIACFNDYSVPEVRSSFCQLRFDNPGNLELIYPGSDQFNQAQETVSLDVSLAAGMALPADAPALSRSTVSQLTVQPFFTDESGAVLYNHFVGEKYLLTLQISEPLLSETQLNLELPAMFSRENLLPERSSCLGSYTPDSRKMTLAAHDFDQEDGKKFTCEFVFASAVPAAVMQTIHFSLTAGIDEPQQVLTPFSWSGIPQSVAKKNQTMQVEAHSGQAILCNQLTPSCAAMVVNEPYLLSIHLPSSAFNAASSDDILIFQWPEGTSEWQQDWSGNPDIPSCVIDANLQTIIENPSEIVQCQFSLTSESSTAARPLSVGFSSWKFEVPDVQLLLPAHPEKRELILSPELMLKLNPLDETDPINQIKADHIAALYRSDRFDSSGAAVYELRIGVNGLPLGRTPISGEKLTLQWNLLDILAGKGTLPGCFQPDSPGVYQMELAVQPDGSWLAVCPFAIPASVDPEVQLTALTIGLALTEDYYEKQITVAENPFTIETIRAVVHLPEIIEVMQEAEIIIDFEIPDSAGVPYAGALLARSGEPLLAVSWDQPEILSCVTEQNAGSVYRQRCSFRFDSLPSMGNAPTLWVDPLLNHLAGLLKIEVWQAGAPSESLSFQLPNVAKVPAVLTFGSIQLADQPEEELPSLYVGQNAFVDLTFSGNAASVDLDALEVSLDNVALDSCEWIQPDVFRCGVPTDCLVYREGECFSEHRLDAVYAGDEVNDRVQAEAISYRLSRYELTITDAGIFDTSQLQHTLQYHPESGSWTPAAVWAEGIQFETFLIRDLITIGGSNLQKTYPLLIRFASEIRSEVQPDSDKFWLQLTAVKSTDGTTAEELIQIPALDWNSAEGTIYFEIDFGSSAQDRSGVLLKDLLAEVSEIQKAEVIYQGDEWYQPAAILWQPPGLHFPLTVVSVFETQQSPQGNQLDFTGSAMDSSQYSVFCSQSGIPLSCGSAEDFHSDGCWGNISIDPIVNPVIYGSFEPAPRCYLAGIEKAGSFDQIRLGDSENEAFR